MSRTNETRLIKWHETCKYKYRLDASVCNNKQRCNNNKNWLTKEYLKGFICNPSNCVGEYLDYANCKRRKRLIDKLVEECNENIDEKEMHLNELISVTSNDY